MFFYKFVPFERKDILENGFIRFTPVQDFNDPFEISPSITPISKKFIEYISNLNSKEAKSLNFNKEDYKYSSERESKVENYRKKYESEVGKFGVLSLSSNNNINQLLTVTFPSKNDPRTNLLMWSHYADSHKGFVIEFECDFVNGMKLKKVNYSEDRHYLTFEDIEEKNFDELILQKSSEWNYEQEYRSVLKLNKADSIIGDKLHLFKIDKRKIHSITFGSRTSDENKKVVMGIIKSDSEYSKVKFNHAYLNDDGYMLSFYSDDGRWSNNPIYGGRSIPNQKKI